MSSPGDRDKSMDLRQSDDDFFTRDLDEALLDGRIDFAVHSAKDLPPKMRDGIDFFFLPWAEDPRDVLVLREGLMLKDIPADGKGLKIGISSGRREKYCLARFPEADQASVRGTIDERILKLDSGEYDILILAAAGLSRLGFADRISEYISTAELAPPEGQGVLALTFRTGDEILLLMRNFLLHPVTFAGASVSLETASLGTVNALKNCDICFYDSLLDESLLSFMSASAKAVYTGKRKGGHSMLQKEISELILNSAKKLYRTVRLKGGDPGIFGRLAEETELLDSAKIPYRVIPAVSSLNAATTGSGLMLTRRGLSRGFAVMTPRRSGSDAFEAVSNEEILAMPRVFFMASSEIPALCGNLRDSGLSQQCPVSVIFAAGTQNESIVSSTIDGIAEAVLPFLPSKAPGIVIAGANADAKYLFPRHGILAGRKVLLTCSEAIMEKAVAAVRRFDGIPCQLPLIKLKADRNALKKLEKLSSYDVVIVSSPAAAQIFVSFLRELKFDYRKIPRIAVMGDATAEELRKAGLEAEFIPERGNGSRSLLELLSCKLPAESKILRLKPDISSDEIARKLIGIGFDAEDLILYQNVKTEKQPLPDSFDFVFFGSSSAVRNYIEFYGKDSLEGKTVAVIGEPTRKTLEEFSPSCRIISSQYESATDSIETLALDILNSSLERRFNEKNN